MNTEAFLRCWLVAFGWAMLGMVNISLWVGVIYMLFRCAENSGFQNKSTKYIWWFLFILAIALTSGSLTLFDGCPK